MTTQPITVWALTINCYDEGMLNSFILPTKESVLTLADHIIEDRQVGMFSLHGWLKVITLDGFKAAGEIDDEELADYIDDDNEFTVCEHGSLEWNIGDCQITLAEIQLGDKPSHFIAVDKPQNYVLAL